ELVPLIQEQHFIGCELHLNVLIRDSGDIHRYFHLKSTKIPFQPVEDVTEFVETLLILRNILVVNMSLLFHAQVRRSRRHMENSSTVFSDPE
ncbi:28492_t:CDS:2, partial [Dentiscutata erythropus]